ncbi:formylglycine-generating enzyme family protein, partial [Desulfobacter sp.]|uniref:formylglycine-generating enzyme family protein n=1 Tax=Desulfobacter sp. TaxID=2294 RepID=UPI00257BA2D9
TVPVKFFEQNPWGLYQMHGNVWEWCQDRWHGNYNGAPDDGSAWEDGDSDYHVCRGGSWINYGRSLRSAFRIDGHHAALVGYGGLRLARGPQDRSGSGTGRSPGKGARDERKKGSNNARPARQMRS